MSKGYIKVGLLLIALLLLACRAGASSSTDISSLQATSLKPFASMYEVDREGFCLTNIDADFKHGHIEWGRGEGRSYDVMLHLYGDEVSRTVAFVRDGDSYLWIGEQEIHRSGRTFTTVDGDISEDVVISYHISEGNGWQKGLRINYWHDVPSGGWAEEITCEEAKRLIEEWAQDAPTP